MLAAILIPQPLGKRDENTSDNINYTYKIL
jgi:hypothetical protein